MKPGPKPTVELKALQTEAANWARVLFVLRDGQVALLTVVKWGEWGDETTVEGKAVQLSPEIRKQLAGTPWENATPLTVRRKTRIGETLEAETFNFEEYKKKLPKEPKPTGPLVWYPPTQAAHRVWRRLKQSRSPSEMRGVLRSLEKWLTQTQSGWWGREYPSNLAQYSDGLLYAKSMHNYPAEAPEKQKRPTSDDKRVLFFAKVFAGLRSRLSPSYATKKLSHWTFSKDAVTNPYKEYMKQIEIGARTWKTRNR